MFSSLVLREGSDKVGSKLSDKVLLIVLYAFLADGTVKSIIREKISGRIADKIGILAFLAAR